MAAQHLPEARGEDVMTAEEVLAVRRQLRANGYCPIPLYGKEPPFRNRKRRNNKYGGLPGWEKLDNVTDEELVMWSKTWPDALNTGALTKHMPVLDADIINEEAARAIEDFVRERFEERGYILPRIGKPPKRAIPFRTEEPFDKITVNLIAANGSTSEKIEFLGDGQQLVVYGIHPETNEPYRWFGGELGKIQREELPYIRKQEAHELVDALVEMLSREHGYQRANERPRKSNGNASGAPDWQYLLDNIREGRELHDSLRDLAAKLVASGMSAGAAVNHLRALMEGLSAPHDERWRERYDDIPRLVESAVKMRDKSTAVTPAARSLLTVHKVFQEWLGEKYDTMVLDAVLATAAAEQLPGDPAWLMIISGPGNAKTETAQSVSTISGAHIVSTIASEGALLSATPRKGRSRGATGGLLRAIGNRGILVIKDFTSILSMERNVRTALMAALREIHDGRWERNVGTDGGQTLSWVGRIVVVAACTTAWDQAHAVVASMGDRFVLIRSDSHKGRTEADAKAIRNTGNEARMRQEMATSVAGLLANLNTTEAKLTDDEMQRILDVADIVTLARTGVETDYRGDVIDVHAPEMPTRFAKQLVQIMRGALALDMTRREALALVVRCARDSIPQLRLAVLDDLKEYGASEAGDIRKRLQKPRRTISRILEALHALGLVICTETRVTKASGAEVTIRKYSLTTATAIGLSALA
jgi:Bifunctional DNA primase/polymerase, N-terminal